MGFLQQTLHERRRNAIHSVENMQQIRHMLRDKPERIEYHRPYTHIFTQEIYTIAEVEHFVKQYAETGTWICVFTELDPQEQSEWLSSMDSIMSIVEHQEIAQRRGIKVMRTIGRVGRLYADRVK